MIRRYWIEILLGLTGLLISVMPAWLKWTNTDVTFYIGSIFGVLALFIALIKHFISISIMEFGERYIPEFELTKEITEIFSRISNRRNEYARNEFEVFVAKLRKIENGQIPLTTTNYYRKIIERIDAAKQGDRILAINLLHREGEVASLTDRQKKYITKNHNAADRGAKIFRIYVLSRTRLESKNPYPESTISEIRNQIKIKGIKIHIVYFEELPPDIKMAEDFVLFDGDAPEIYSGKTDIKNPNRLIDTRLVLTNVQSYKDQFASILDHETTDHEFLKVTGEIYPNLSDTSHEDAPGLKLEAIKLDKNVVSCEEAAAAKGIPLEKELKTIIIKVGDGFKAVHLRGDKGVSLRSVKNFLRVDQAKLASEMELAALSLSKGRVSAVLSPVWEMDHLIDSDLLNLNEVSTNAGKLNEYYLFDPEILIQSKSNRVGAFSKIQT